MAITLDQLGKAMSRIGFVLEKNTEEAVRTAALTAHHVATITTPVKTARARSNWKLDIGVPNPSNNAPPVEGSAEAATQHSLGNAQASAALWTLKAGGLILTNGVPYIETLDAGSSQQAPQGMTPAAMQAAENVFRVTDLLRGA